MKIAIPVKTDRENPAAAPLFGKAKWFAFVEDGKINIKKNPAQGGHEVIRWFASNNIDAIIFMEMGVTPYELIKSLGTIKLYHAGFERILLEEIVQKFDDNTLTELNEEKMLEIIAHHETKH